MQFRGTDLRHHIQNNSCPQPLWAIVTGNLKSMLLDFLYKFFAIGKSTKSSKVFDGEGELSHVEDDKIKPFGKFEVKCDDKIVLDTLNRGDCVNLYTRIDLDDVKIYSKGSIGGNGFIGFIPYQLKGIIRDHLLNTISNFGTKTIETKIVEIHDNNLRIEYELISQNEINKVEALQLSDFIQARETELNKAYKMKTPVELEFFDFDFSKIDEDFSLGFKSKDWYIQNPLSYPIQLIGKDGAIINESHSQKAIVDRILKAHFNGHRLDIINKFKRYERLVLTIAPAPQN